LIADGVAVEDASGQSSSQSGLLTCGRAMIAHEFEAESRVAEREESGRRDIK
jgi:hypothetical protein